MTAAEMFRQAQWEVFFAPLMVPKSFAGWPTKQPRFPTALAKHPAFTVSLDTKRLDIGLAAAMDKHRRLGG